MGRRLDERRAGSSKRHTGNRRYPDQVKAHGRRGLKRLVGGDAEYIVRHSPVPVLLVRGP
ncbi:MAG TPA: universal stress protein [Steroidobacteraceae bacterium]|nr:universal stress protein [Steroidobacteraceae bacterium]